MGVDLNTQENHNHSYVHIVKDLLQIIGMRFFSIFYRFDLFFYLFCPLKNRYSTCLKESRNFTESVLLRQMSIYNKSKEVRDEEVQFAGRKKSNLMQLLLNKYENNQIDFEGIREEIDTLILAVSGLFIS